MGTILVGDVVTLVVIGEHTEGNNLARARTKVAGGGVFLTRPGVRSSVVPGHLCGHFRAFEDVGEAVAGAGDQLWHDLAWDWGRFRAVGGVRWPVEARRSAKVALTSIAVFWAPFVVGCRRVADRLPASRLGRLREFNAWSS